MIQIPLFSLSSFKAGITLVFFTAFLCAISVRAEDKAVPQTRADITFSFAPVVKKAAPAVVNIYARGKVQVQQPSPFMNDPFFRQFFGNQPGAGGQTRERVVSSLGSGVIVRADGTIVTSHHVIKDAQEIRVVLADKREFDAKVMLRDPQFDLAFLKIDVPEKLPFLEMRDSESLEVGDLVLAIGDPFGVGQTVTNGIVSALSRAARGVSDYQYFIQTDAPINPGNSGGALVDMNGRLIGINTAIYSSSGGSNGIGFAVPANMVRSLLEGKIQGGRAVRAWLGAVTQAITPEIAESLGLKGVEGVIVKKLAPDSPAEEGGLMVGDVILSIGGAEIASDQQLQYRVALAKVGSATEFQILRDGNRKTLSVTMETPPEMPPRDQRKLSGSHALDGITVANLSPALAQELGLENSAAQGVVVLANAGNRFHVNIPLQPGDVLVELNGSKITSSEQLEALLKPSANSWKIAYQRGDKLLTLTINR